MKNSVKIIFSFTLGAAVGLVATQRFFKAKYEAIAQEEIDSVKEVYSKKHKDNMNEVDENVSSTPENVEEYANIVHDLRYTNNKKEGG